MCTVISICCYFVSDISKNFDFTPEFKRCHINAIAHIIRTKLILYFGSRKMVDITVRDIIKWQNGDYVYRGMLFIKSRSFSKASSMDMSSQFLSDFRSSRK
ncbi:MAG: hypothetical protein E7282_11470 [Lachnospiraceae bacterium]|nr:hypothetical protein [Lachnospiraceae bacterium]